MQHKINIKAIIQLLRPKQWLKNFFVFAAIIFSGNFLNPSLLKLNIMAFLLFCLTSSTIYILNDIVDVEKDRQHPQKKFRPIASGEVTNSQAIILLILFIILVLISSINLSFKLAMIYISYIIINVFYSFKLKNVVIIDVLIITFGFVLRLESGSIVTNVTLSPWLILCTILLSLFLAINKRKSELITLEGKSKSHRKILEDYSIPFLDKMLSTVTPSILISYCLYTFSSVQSKTMMLTIPFVLYGIFRYQYLMEKENIGGKPEDVFTKDLPFLINIVLWIASILFIIYFKL